jgi:predicted DNA-binding transcriptional regulator AlpA
LPVARPEVTGRRLTTASPAASTTAAAITTTEPTTTDPLSMLSKSELADLLSVDPWTIDRWRRPDEPTYDPDFPEPIWISGATPRWRRIHIERWLARRPAGGLSPNWVAHPKPTHKNRKRRQRADR